MFGPSVRAIDNELRLTWFTSNDRIRNDFKSSPRAFKPRSKLIPCHQI